MKTFSKFFNKSGRNLLLTMALVCGLVIAATALVSCDDGGDDKGGGNTFTITSERYITVPYEGTGNSYSRAVGSYLDKLIYSAYDATTNYYVFLLGNINKVPIAYRNAYEYNGTTPITIGYTKSETTETSIANAMSTAVDNSITKSLTAEWSVNVSVGFSVEAVSSKVSTTIGGSIGVETSETRSTSNTYETTKTKVDSGEDSISVTIGEHDEPAGKYRYTYFGTTDVYYVIQTNKEKTKVKSAYFALCARPLSYAWAVDYEPDPAGSFGKTGAGDLLVPPEVTLADLSFPQDEVDFNYVPNAQPAETPVASPAGGTYPTSTTLSVELTSATPTAEIYFTTDGTDPIVSSTKYKNPIILEPGTTTIKAIAIAEDFDKSAIMSETYAIVATEWTETRLYKINTSDGDPANMDHTNTDPTTINDDDGKKEFFTAGFDVEGLKKASYTNLVFKLTFDAREITDGWIDVLVVKGHRGSTADHIYENQKDFTVWKSLSFDIDNDDDSWNTFSPDSFTVSINDFSNEFMIAWVASGSNADEWQLASRTVTITATKPQQ